MSPPSLDPESSSLFGHLETLYPLACLLAGPDEADVLLRRVFERASKSPPTDRPADRQAWLLRLLLDEHGDSPLPADALAHSRDSTSDSSDPYREEVAERVLEEALPTAMAACSVQERFLLALDVFGDADEPPNALATALDTTTTEAQQLHANAWAALRSHLRGVLSEAEQTLVEEALPVEAVPNAVEHLLANRFPRVPTSIRSQIRRILQTATPPEESPTEDSVPSQNSTPGFNRLSSGLRERSLLGGLAVLVVVAAVGLGVFFLTPPASAPSSHTSLVAFSAERAHSVQLELKTNTPSDAEAYVGSNWNRRVAVPSVDGAPLQGVGQLRIASGVEVPVFGYGGTDDRLRVAIFAYSYALLDEMESQVALDAGLRRELGQSKHLVTHQSATEDGVLWRSRDDVFVAVVPSASVDSLDLRNRLRPES